MEYLTIALRSLISIIVLFILSKLIGPRQISQLTFYDYIVGITIGSIAAVAAVEQDIPIMLPIIAMVVYALFTVFASLLTNKSIIMRRFFTGVPSVLIDNGKIIEKNLMKNHLDINDLLSYARAQGYFNINDIAYCVMEPTGKVSFLPKEEQKPLTPKDMQIITGEDTIFADVIIDGHIMEKNLISIGKTVQWLKEKIKEQGHKSENDILVAICDRTGNIVMFRKNEKGPKENYFA